MIALGVSLLATRFVRDHARRIGIFDPFDPRKVHKEPVPRIGGLGIVIGVIASVGALIALYGYSALNVDRPFVALAIGGVLMHLFGLIDDLLPVRARYKLLGQVLIATGVALFGFSINSMTLPLVGQLDVPEWLAIGITVFWLVGLTNAFNLIDGLDGLAAGVALFALTAISIVAVMHGQVAVALLAVCLGAATFGFLRYNTPPATIFLGDSGSLFMGFMLAGTGALASRVDGQHYALVIPLIALGVPATDTAVAILRRFLRRHKIFAPDRGHIHHRLLARGHSPAQVVQTLYWAAAAAAVSALILALNADRYLRFMVFAVVSMTTFVKYLKFYEFQELARLVRRGANPRRVIGRNVRFHEAGHRLAQVQIGAEIVEALDHAFADDPISKVELRLQRGFISRQLAVVHEGGRADDEVTVWRYAHEEEAGPECWEVSIPLCGDGDHRIGSLVIWESGLTSDSVSHLQVIAGPLRMELEHKLRTIGWPVPAEISDGNGEESDGAVAASGGSAAAVSSHPPAENLRTLWRRFKPSA